MARFKDRMGDEWELSIDVPTVARVRRETDKRFDLLSTDSLVDGKPIGEALNDDIVLLWEVLWHLVEPQAKQRSITAEQFGQRMSEECLIATRAKFLEEWADFFRRCQRPEIGQALALLSRAHETARTELAKALGPEKMEQAQKIVDEKIRNAIGATSGSWLALLESIQIAE